MRDHVYAYGVDFARKLTKRISSCPTKLSVSTPVLVGEFKELSWKATINYNYKKNFLLKRFEFTKTRWPVRHTYRGVKSYENEELAVT